MELAASIADLLIQADTYAQRAQQGVNMNPPRDVDTDPANAALAVYFATLALYARLDQALAALSTLGVQV